MNTATTSSFFFTSPWNPLSTRRGDALGLRALTDVFAEAVAPDLSNRVEDGRWVTILAWCLVRSQSAYHAAGGGHIVSRADQRQRYAWLRPLELMWVARTLGILGEADGRTLPGQRSVKPWLEQNRRPEKFGMSDDQFQAYRQTGAYGGYRVAFRRWSGMTKGGDGWTPAPATRDLATWLEGRLGRAGRLRGGSDWPSSKSAKRSLGKEDSWWLRNLCEFDISNKAAEASTLPRPRSEYKKLPEHELLTPLVFGDGQSAERRRSVAQVLQAAKPNSHREACEALADQFSSDPTIRALAAFSRLADAGMEVMDLIANEVIAKGVVSLHDIAASATHCCGKLFAAAEEWQKLDARGIRHIDEAHRFAERVSNSAPLECLRNLLHYHETYGGGQRWFVERDGRIEARVSPRGGSSRYRFRLWSLCRLGAQCGVLRTMPRGLVKEWEGSDE